MQRLLEERADLPVLKNEPNASTGGRSGQKAGLEGI